MSSWPATLVSISAALCAWTIHAAGASVVARAVRRSGWARLDAWLLGWLLFLPLAGGFALALAAAGFATEKVLRTSLALLLVAAILPLRPPGALGSLWTSLGRWRYAAIPVAALKALEILFSAHPQRLYDQLNYHLVVSKHVLASGRLVGHHYDPHLVIAGPIEYAFLFPRALVADDLFVTGVAQAWIYAAVVGTGALAALVLAKSRAFGEAWRAPLLLAAMAALPGLVPDAEMVHIAKPNGLLLAGAMALLAFRLVGRERFLAAAPGVTLAMVAANQTFLHAALALGLVAALARPRLEELFARRALVVTACGLFCLALATGKSIALSGTPFFPSDAALLGSPLSDEVSKAYWRRTAFGDGGAPLELRHAAGAVDVLLRQPLLAVWLAALAALAWRAQRGERSLASNPALAPLVVFVAAFAAAWPLFYFAEIYSRFVAAYVGALLVLGLALLVRLPRHLRPAGVTLTVLLGVSGSHADVMARKIAVWSRGTAGEAMTAQFPRWRTAQLVNSLIAGGKGAVLADDAGKLFFDQAVLHGTLGPRERRLWSELAADARAVARSQGLKAVVVSRETLSSPWDPYMVGPIAAVWRQLAPYGRPLSSGPDLVLYSDCAFAAMPCDLGHAQNLGYSGGAAE